MEYILKNCLKIDEKVLKNCLKIDEKMIAGREKFSSACLFKEIGFFLNSVFLIS
jgi:hypothetical protein